MTTLDELARTAKKTAKLRKEEGIWLFDPYPKQKLFCKRSSECQEVMLMAGNQLGKSLTAAHCAAYHMMGEYPDWWEGKRFKEPTRGWIAGESSTVVRDVQQKLLCGEPGVSDGYGTGIIPRDRFADKPTLARGVTNAFDTIQVKHKAGGISVARYKSYEQGREKFQGETLDWIWNDEEPDMEIYTEELTRLAVRDGIMMVTFTPMKGATDLTERFKQESKDRALVQMSIYDVHHFDDPDKRRKHLERYPAHERKARLEGVPMLGSGAIFVTPEETLMEAQIVEYLPQHWTKLWGIDFGIDHPFAAVLSAWDRDNDVIHILHTIRMRLDPGTLNPPLMHAAAMKSIGAAVPVAWPHDGTQRDKGSGDSLATIYKKQGLAMLGDHATFPEGGYSTEAAIMEMQERMTTGRLKVANHLSDWFEEYRSYHRKDGQIVKERDDLMSATQKIIMMKRYGRPVALGNKAPTRRPQGIARDVDFDLE